MRIKDNSHYGKDKDSLNFWKLNRNKLVDLYKSERKFFPSKVQKCKSFLDVGCAAGGFCKIISSIKPSEGIFSQRLRLSLTDNIVVFDNSKKLIISLKLPTTCQGP